MIDYGCLSGSRPMPEVNQRQAINIEFKRQADCESGSSTTLARPLRNPDILFQAALNINLGRPIPGTA